MSFIKDVGLTPCPHSLTRLAKTRHLTYLKDIMEIVQEKDRNQEQDQMDYVATAGEKLGKENSTHIKS